MTTTIRLALVFFIVFLLHGVNASDYSQEEDEESFSDSIELNPTAEGQRVRRSLATAYCQDDRILTSRIDCGWPGISSRNCTNLNCCYDPTRPSPKCYIKYGGKEVTTHRFCDFRNPFDRKDCGFPEITPSGCEERGCCYDNRVWGGVVHCFHNTTGNSVRSTSSPPTLSTTTASPDDVCCDSISKSQLNLLMSKIDTIKKSVDALNKRCQ